MRWIMAILASATAAGADPTARIAEAAEATFARMPQVVVVDQIAGQCGATDDVDPRVAYCTTENVILVAKDAVSLAQTPYLLGHGFGHAVQVQHGVADIALAAIRTRPDDEVMLRGLVERQVDCIAGYLLQQAGLAPLDLADLFKADPLNAPHWGRDPLSRGPTVSVDLDARGQWFDIGQSGDLAACAPGEFTSDLLVQARR